MFINKKNHPTNHVASSKSQNMASVDDTDGHGIANMLYSYSSTLFSKINQVKRSFWSPTPNDVHDDIDGSKHDSPRRRRRRRRRSKLDNHKKSNGSSTIETSPEYFYSALYHDSDNVPMSLVNNNIALKPYAATVSTHTTSLLFLPQDLIDCGEPLSSLECIERAIELVESSNNIVDEDKTKANKKNKTKKQNANKINGFESNRNRNTNNIHSKNGSDNEIKNISWRAVAKNSAGGVVVTEITMKVLSEVVGRVVESVLAPIFLSLVLITGFGYLLLRERIAPMKPKAQTSTVDEVDESNPAGKGESKSKGDDDLTMNLMEEGKLPSGTFETNDRDIEIEI